METSQFQQVPNRLRIAIDAMLDELLLNELDDGNDDSGDGGGEKIDENLNRLRLIMLVRAFFSRKRSRR